MRINQQEINNVIRLDAFKRYRYYIKRIADNEKMYTLINENGDYALSKFETYILIPFWPFAEYALISASCKWFEYSPIEIDFDKFNDEMFLYIKENGYLLNIFPVDEKTGFVVSLDEFLQDLNAEIETLE